MDLQVPQLIWRTLDTEAQLSPGSMEGAMLPGGVMNEPSPFDELEKLGET